MNTKRILHIRARDRSKINEFTDKRAVEAFYERCMRRCDEKHLSQFLVGDFEYELQKRTFHASINVQQRRDINDVPYIYK